MSDSHNVLDEIEKMHQKVGQPYIREGAVLKTLNKRKFKKLMQLLDKTQQQAAVTGFDDVAETISEIVDQLCFKYGDPTEEQ